jgi:hypothetical protein
MIVLIVEATVLWSVHIVVAVARKSVGLVKARVR